LLVPLENTALKNEVGETEEFSPYYTLETLTLQEGGELVLVETCSMEKEFEEEFFGFPESVLSFSMTQGAEFTM